jgi:hypothetical protein
LGRGKRTAQEGEGDWEKKGWRKWPLGQEKGRWAERGEGERKSGKVACRLGYWTGSGWFPTFFLFSLFKLKLKPIEFK